MDQFLEISVILLIAFVISSLMRYLKQPLVIGYILTGIIVGPYFLDILTSIETVKLFSELGIAALLFIVGLGLSPKILKELGKVSAITGVGQVLFTSFFGFIISILLGFSPIQAFYISVALTFSSTIIILKLLSDRGDVGKLYGKIAIGFLLVQDLIATIVLISISGITNIKNATPLVIVADLSLLLLQGFLILGLLFMISIRILPKFDNFISKSQEYLFVFSITWGIAIAALYSWLGLSIEIGALVAGVALSMTPYSHEIGSRLKPLRDFFITIFFIMLGYQMVFTNWEALLFPTIILSVFILIGNPIIVLLLMNFLGYTRKTGFMAGLTVAQISEFSLILMKLGYDVGHVSEEVMSMVTMVGVVTIAGSTYMILYSDQLYRKLEKYLSFLDIKTSRKAKQIKEKNHEAIIFGYRRAGPEFAYVFQEKNLNYLVIDYNPDTIHELEELKIECEYGDASDVEFLQELPLKTAKYIISTIPDFETNIIVTQTIRKYNKSAILIVISDTPDDAVDLYKNGVTNVVLSHYIGAKHAASMISEYGDDLKKYKDAKKDHLKYLDQMRKFNFQPKF